jgi:PAS domain S-box-containing protein
MQAKIFSIRGPLFNSDGIHFEQLIHALPVYVSYVDADLRYRFVNEHYKKLIKVNDVYELVGKTVLEVVGEESFNKVKHHYEKVLQGEAVSHVSDLTYKDNIRKVMQADYIPDKTNDGKVQGFFILVADVTEKTTLEQELRISREDYKYIFERSPQPMCIWDLENYKIMNVNEAMEAHYGYTKNEFLNMTVLDLKPREDVETFMSDAALLKPGHRVEKRLFRHMIKDGTVINVLNSSNEVIYNGRRSRIVLLTDVSEQVAVEEDRESLVSSQKRSLEALTTILNVGKTINSKLEVETIIQTVMDAALRITSAEFGEFLLPDTISFSLKKTIRSEDLLKDSQRPLIDDKNLRSYLAVPVVSSAGEVFGAVVLGHSKTLKFDEQDKMIVEGLASQASIALDNARLYEKSQRSLKVRDEFLSMASHELKTPITSLILQSQIRKRKLIKDQDFILDKATELSQIEKQTKLLFRLNRLIDDMLDVSRIRTGKLKINSERVDIVALVKETLERLKPQLLQSVNELTCELVEEVHVEADAFRIEQVLTNLLTNVMRYGRGKAAHVEVLIVDDKAMVRIKDHGLGISEKDQKRIFTRFERAVPCNEISGLGLGLSIVKDIIDAHGGEVGVISELGQGSTFWFSLPTLPCGVIN